ncbi:MAG: zinc ribbon-containing protein [Gammaproteobacteria bacterium]|nr:zinc ribbon-containing protein [Gammaproteobacteria bacterium]
MNKSKDDDPLDALGEAYETMYERAAENLHNAKEKSGSLLHKFIDEAQEKAVALEELTKEDAEKLSGWLKRDLDDTIDYLAETDYELKDWLGFETTFLETVLLDSLLQTADKTTVELLAIKENARLASIYSTGEITGPGTLICDQCGEILHFHKAGKIPPCPKCHATRFHRKTK